MTTQDSSRILQPQLFNLGGVIYEAVAYQIVEDIDNDGRTSNKSAKVPHWKCGKKTPIDYCDGTPAEYTLVDDEVQMPVDE